MPEATRRRTDAFKLRLTVSQLLEEIDAVEHAMALFLRTHDREDLARAREDFQALRKHMDQLGDLLVSAAETEPAERVTEAAE
jgi:hypothetical protein